MIKFLYGLFQPAPVKVREKMLAQTELELIEAEANLDRANANVAYLTAMRDRLREQIDADTHEVADIPDTLAERATSQRCPAARWHGFRKGAEVREMNRDQEKS